MIFADTALESIEHADERSEAEELMFGSEELLHFGEKGMGTWLRFGKNAGVSEDIEAIFDHSDPSEEERRFAGLHRYEFCGGTLYPFLREYLSKHDDIYLISMYYGGHMFCGGDMIKLTKKFRDMEIKIIDVNEAYNEINRQVHNRSLGIRSGTDEVMNVKGLESRRDLLDFELYTIYKFIDGGKVL